MTTEKTIPSDNSLPATIIQTPSVRVWPLWLLIIILLALFSGASWYSWHKFKTLDTVQTRLSSIESNKQSQQALLSTLDQRIDGRLAAVTSLQNSLKQTTQTHEKQIAYNSQQLAQVGGSSRTDWLLAEAEYLLRLANQRLNMERDYKGAELILQGADQVMAESDDQGLYEVRKQLANELLALQNINRIDYEGIYLQLEALINLTSKMNQTAFIQEEHMAPPKLEKLTDNSNPTKGWKQVWLDTKAELGHLVDQLIIIRRMDEQVAPLLAPEQVYYLQQNLRLMLEQAELALLERNQQIYQRSLKKALAWVEQYLVNDSPEKALIVGHLETLSQHNISPELPDISGSLKLLKNRVSLLYRQHHDLTTNSKGE